jgi:hypothetical protein
MPIATIDAVLTVTPQDEIQIVYAEHEYEIIDDRTPFKIRVSDVMHENGTIIAVAGPVIDGPDRYRGMIATLLTRLWGSHWETDVRTQANFKVGHHRARRVSKFPHDHPEGAAIDSYPFILRFGQVDAEV